MQLKIVPLSKKTLESAMKLVNLCFPVKMKNEDSDSLLQASLGLKNITIVDKKCVFVKYWVIVNNKKVIGVVGLSGNKGTINKEYWLDYLCVEPHLRRKGIGNKLLNFAINKAREDGKKYVRILTTESSDEAAAQFLYEKTGFKIIKYGKEKGFPYKLIYRKLPL